jgi:putative membrane protein
VPIPTTQRWMLAAIAAGIPLSAIGALYPSNTWLQVGPVALLIPGAVLAFRHWPLSNASAGSIAAFGLLHLFAARWSYSFVPYDAWFPGINEALGFERNMFDRLVHFLFGVLAVLPFVELAVRYGGLKARTAIAGAVLFVLAAGSLYEVFEWILTLAMSPEDAGAYNGEQGDMFDGQKDMAIAAFGAVLAVLPVASRLKRTGAPQAVR